MQAFDHLLKVTICLYWMMYVTQKCGLMVWGGLSSLSITNSGFNHITLLLMGFSEELEAHLLLSSLTLCYLHALCTPNQEQAGSIFMT